jgi:phenylpropionate dioxygenase-like ring-hydroxylating dioxygenase large terminal subunit
MPTETAPPLADPILQQEWFAIAWSSEVQPGNLQARRLLATDLVLWRSQQGLHCWRDLCIHRGAKLSLGVIHPAADRQPTDCLVCPYHAWEYAPSGQCVHIPAHPGLTPPAKAHAQTYHVVERYGVVWVSLGEFNTELPTFPIADQPGIRTILCGPYRMHAKGPRIVENFLDVAHLGFVHAGLLGDPQHGEVEDYEVTPGTATTGPEAREIRIWQPNPDGTGQPALVNYHYWVNAPLTVGLTKTDGGNPESAQRLGILAQIAPIDEENSEIRLIFCLNYGDQHSDDELRSFQDRVTEQDRLIVESQRPELLPLDLQSELHLRSDRMAIAYRKWLREIGFTYGTA